MATISQFFQPPQHWQQFEELTVGVLRELHGAVDAQGYGRPGQAQNGVDVFGTSRDGQSIAVQCKRLPTFDDHGHPHPGGPISKKFLRSAADEVGTFGYPLDVWILATTARRERRVQDEAHKLNSERRSIGIKTRVIVWFWDDYVAFLNNFPTLQTWYYRDVIEVRNADDLDRMILRTMATAFDRPAFEVHLNSEVFELFDQALKDTQRALKTGMLVDRETGHIIQRAIGGVREIRNVEWKAGVMDAEKHLSELRNKLEAGFKNQTIVRHDHFMEFRDPLVAMELTRLRDEARDAMHLVLRSAGL